MQKIRAINRYLEVVVCTNEANTTLMQELINLGISGFLKKGANANLWDIVDFIKSKFEPLDDADRKQVLDTIFPHLPIID